MVKQGDKVRVEGVVATVETTWGSGKYKVFKLDDGREILDLHKGVERGDAEIVSSEPEVVPEPAPRIVKLGDMSRNRPATNEEIRDVLLRNLDEEDE